jgi:hypothetical protein
VYPGAIGSEGAFNVEPLDGKPAITHVVVPATTVVPDWRAVVGAKQLLAVDCVVMAATV